MEAIEKERQNKFDQINFKSYLSSLIIIFILMVITYILTFVFKGGQYQPIFDTANPDKIIDYTYTLKPDADFPFWKFLLSPILVLGSEGNLLLIEILAFLCVIGGVFETLTKCNFMEYLLKKLVKRFYKRRYALIYVLTLFFMLLGSFVGTFEEVIPMIPFICALTVSLGFDNLIGLGVSLLAAGGGFAAGILNPFTIGIAQSEANDVLLGKGLSNDIPLFSGAWLRIVTFILIYVLLTTFLVLHAKRIEKKSNKKINTEEFKFESNKKLDRSVLCFGLILGTSLVLVISSIFIKFLQDYTLVIMALGFFVGGIVAALVSGIKFLDLLKTFGKGIVNMLPAIVMILFASSIRYILVESSRLDTLVYNLMSIADGLSPYILILFIYFIVFLVEIFIASGSAKAMLLIPLIIPISQAFGLPANLVCLAYIFGDGFSNYIYPSDAALLISLNLSDYTYLKYIKDTWVYHLITIIITAGILLLGVAIGYH